MRSAASSELPTEGNDAVWLADSYGLTCDVWQVGILVDWLRVDDGRWASARCGTAVPRQNGKNGALEVRELYGMVALGERFLHTAHEVKTARKAFRRLLEFFDGSFPELAGMVSEVRRTNGQEAIFLVNGGSVEFVARSKGSGRGFSVDVLVLDEAQELTEDELEALRPTVSASNNPQVILTGTPPRGHGEAGRVFARMRAAGVNGEDARLAWSEWSCDDDLDVVDLDDRGLWAACNPALGVRLREQTVADERAEFTDESFARERLGWWQPETQRSAALDVERWQALADPAAALGRPIFALATHPEREWSCLAMAWTRPDGHRHVALADYKPGTAWVEARVADLRAKYGRDCVKAVDTASRGLVDADEPSQQAQAQAHNAFADAVLAGTVHHGDEAALNTAVRASRWRALGDSRVLDRKGAADISPLVAAALALHGLTSGKSQQSKRLMSF